MLQPKMSSGSALAAPFDTTILEQFPAMVWIDDPNMECVFMNRCALEFTGRSREREEGTGWMEPMHPDDRASYLALYREAFAVRREFDVEYRLRRHDGVYRWVLEKGAPLQDELGKFGGYLGFFSDVTERRKADAARREVEEEVRILGLITRDFVWNWDAQAGRVVCNDAFGDTLGEPPAILDAALEWWNGRVHPDDREAAEAAMSEAIAGGAMDILREYRFCGRDGRWIAIEDRARIVRDGSGNLVRLFGAMRDITERKAAEHERERLAKIIEATPDLVAIAYPDGGLIHINDAGRTLLGWPRGAAAQVHNLVDFHPDWANEITFKEALPAALANGSWSGESALLAGDGREIPVLQQILAHPGPDGRIEYVSTIMRDISDRKVEEVARMEAANRYSAAIRASGQILFDWNASTHEVTYSGDVERILGYTLAELRGTLDRFGEIIHHDDRTAFDGEVLRVTASREPFRLKFRVLRKDGREIVIDGKGNFFLDRTGHFGRMVGFLADVSAQQAAQDALTLAHDDLEQHVEERTAELALANARIQSRARQQEAVAQIGRRALAGASLPSVFSEAAALVSDTLNVELCSILELGEDQSALVVKGSAGWPESATTLRVPIGASSQAGYTLLTCAPVTSRDFSVETRFRLSEAVRMVGAKSGVSVMIQAGDKPIGVLAALALQVRDFTAEDVHFLQAVANVLTAAIDRQRAEASIRLAQEQAESANRAKSEFLSRMSHELRTPLNAILGFTQLLELETLAPSQVESVSHISRGGAHLLAMINQVLDIARIDTGRLALTPEAVDIGGTLREAIELIGPLASRNAVTIILDPSCEQNLWVWADRQRLKQVFHNLLSNGVKYNRVRGKVTLAGERNGDRVQVRIADTGWGIAPEKMGRLFIPFDRLGAESSEVEGTGIGLALAQRIVGTLGGSVTAESHYGKGSVFTVELPAAERPVLKTPAAPRDLAPLVAVPDTCTILYIEDQDLNLKLVERIVKRQPDLRLISAMQGSLGLELAREHRPDLILLDLNLPDISGEEVLKRLKADPDLRSIPVVMVSADALGDRIQQLLATGAENYITKPYRVPDFLRIVNEALGKRGT